MAGGRSRVSVLCYQSHRRRLQEELFIERSARSTFPELQGFRVGKIRGYRRAFACNAPIFFQRGIANVETGEVSSVGVEPTHGDAELMVTLFEIRATPKAIQAFIDREHEFKFEAVQPYTVENEAEPHLAVICTLWADDEEYRRVRCSAELFEEKFGRFGIERVMRDDILPCRLYVRHCYLAAKNLMPSAVLENFLDCSYLGDRKTTLRTYLHEHPDVLTDEPPPEIADRYSG